MKAASDDKIVVNVRPFDNLCEEPSNAALLEKFNFLYSDFKNDLGK
jgi:hypothetical protein